MPAWWNPWTSRVKCKRKGNKGKERESNYTNCHSHCITVGCGWWNVRCNKRQGQWRAVSCLSATGKTKRLLWKMFSNYLACCHCATLAVILYLLPLSYSKRKPVFNVPPSYELKHSCYRLLLSLFGKRGKIKQSPLKRDRFLLSW